METCLPFALAVDLVLVEGDFDKLIFAATLIGPARLFSSTHAQSLELEGNALGF